MTWPLDRHLDDDELNALVTAQSSGASIAGSLFEGALREARQHVESCQDCDRKVQMHRSVQSAIASRVMRGYTPKGLNCQDEADWVKVAAGLIEESEARERMKHAAQCGYCGPLFKAAAKTLSDETSSAEEAALANLYSARPAWQARMAHILSNTRESRRTSGSASSFWNTFFPRPRPAFVIAGFALIVAASWIGVRILHPPSAEQLLARAYTERRTIEVRISGAKYAPLRVERSVIGSNFDKPEPLLRAEALIGKNLQQTPDDPRWLQARARADVLDGNYDAAIKTLQRALESQPGSAQILTDLGSAYFLRAKSSDRPIDYGNAIESFGKVLVKNPNDQIALFNRALACEGMFLYVQAVDDWEHYLRIDPEGGWAEEARERLRRLREKIEEHEKGAANLPSTPKELLAYRTEHSGDLSVLDGRIERYLELSIKSWSPDVLARPNSSAAGGDEITALELIALLMASKHEDPWLADFLHGPQSQIKIEAFNEFLASENAAHAGRYGDAIEYSRHSVEHFQESVNQAGMLRASLQLMLSQALALKYGDCLRTATTLLPRLATTRYHWLQSAAWIEQAQCLGGTAQLSEAIASNARGSELAIRFRFRELQLRATAFGAGYLLDKDPDGRGLTELARGLAVFWQSDAVASLGQNLYAVLSDFADLRQWPNVEAFSLTEMLVHFPTKNKLEQAVELEFLAEAQQKAGAYHLAQATLSNETRLLETVPSDNAVVLRKAEIAVANASINLRLGNPHLALSTLAPLHAQFEIADSGQFQAEYFRILGETYLALGDFAEAQPELERASALVETGLSNLREETDRLSWSRTRGQVYRDLLQVKLHSATPEETFLWWEWYKSASLRPKTEPGISNTFSSFAAQTSLPAELPQNTALISYVLTEDSIIAFLFHDGTVRVHHLDQPQNLQSLSEQFLTHCADPATDIHLLNTESVRLYDALIMPIESELQGVSLLHIETDGVLDKLPFALLRRADGIFLGDKFVVIFSPGLAYRSHADGWLNTRQISRSSAALIVIASNSQDPSSPLLPETTVEGQEVASHFDHAIVVSSAGSRSVILRDLANMEIFHFAGHAVADVHRVGLLLGTGELLTAHDLARSKSPNLQLAVLSACDTANGASDSTTDANSAVRVLTAAGVPKIIGSRWKVDSLVTSLLMRAFYANLMSGESPAESLRAASIEIRRRPQYQHPYYWGSFAVFSNL